MAICLDFDWQTNEFMLYCRTTQLREKTMLSYEQTLRLFEKWCKEEQSISTVDKVNENVIRRYIFDLQERGKYTFYSNDKQKAINYPERRRDFRKPVSTITINNYIRNLRVFFNYLERNYIIKKNPMKRVRQLKSNREPKVYLTDDELRKLLSKFDRSYFSEHRDYEEYTPHCLRNNFAKRCLMNGMDIYTLSKILGHSSVTVTEQAYLDINDDDMSSTADLTAPDHSGLLSLSVCRSGFLPVSG